MVRFGLSFFLRVRFFFLPQISPGPVRFHTVTFLAAPFGGAFLQTVSVLAGVAGSLFTFRPVVFFSLSVFFFFHDLLLIWFLLRSPPAVPV